MFNIRIADLVVRIDNRCDDVREFCRDYIVSDDLPADIEVSVTEEDIVREIVSTGVSPALLNQKMIISKAFPVCERLGVYRKICREMIKHDGFLMHASVVAVDGEGYAFCAKSGTGKTTHTRLWLEKFGNRAQVVNGDKPLFRFIDGELYAFGTPWNGSERMGDNIKAPLKALAFIERSETNTTERMPKSQVIERIFHQMLMPADEESLDRFMNMVETMIDTIPSYLIRCNMDMEAADVAWQSIRGD